jgi:hypothetical protein
MPRILTVQCVVSRDVVSSRLERVSLNHIGRGFLLFAVWCIRVCFAARAEESTPRFFARRFTIYSTRSATRREAPVPGKAAKYVALSSSSWKRSSQKGSLCQRRISLMRLRHRERFPFGTKSKKTHPAVLGLSSSPISASPKPKQPNHSEAQDGVPDGPWTVASSTQSRKGEKREQARDGKGSDFR